MSKATTPLSLARAECANWHAGACLGIALEQSVRFEHGHKRIPTREPQDKCLVAAGKACGYFEACVLPRPVFAATAAAYYGAQGRAVPNTTGRTCPDCGKPLAKRQRVCPDCRRHRRRTSSRQSQARARSAVNS